MRPALRLRSVEFRREREKAWRELEGIVRNVERSGLRSLSAAEIGRLPVLYRAALSSLSVARAVSLDRNVLEYLEALTARAYSCVYAARRPLGKTAARFLSHTFPATVREFWRAVLLSALACALGVLVGWALTSADSERFYAFVPAGLAGDRGPASSTESLRKVLYTEGGSTAFAAFLYAHNIGVGIFSFAIGFAGGVLSLWLMFTNGLTLGAFCSLYASRGLLGELLAWILPHGGTELFAVVLCGAAGVVVGSAIVFPGQLSRLDNLTLQGRKAGVVVCGAAGLLVLAGMVEGIFRQTVLHVPARWALAATLAAWWVFYFAFFGRGAAPTDGEGVA